MDCRTGEVLFQKKLPAEANRKIIGLSQEERVSSILTYQDGLIITCLLYTSESVSGAWKAGNQVLRIQNMKGKGSLRSGGFLCFLCKFCCYQLFVGNPGIQFTRFFKNIDVYKRQVLDVVDEGNRLIQFSYDGIFEEILDQLGQMPLPPYICLLYTSRCV